MWRCIMFQQLFPEFLLHKEPGLPYDRAVVQEDTSAEEAMWACVSVIVTNTEPTEWLRQYTTWQPSSGKVYVQGELCGVVFWVASILDR